MATRLRYVGASSKMYLGYQESLDWMRGIASVVGARPGLAAAGVVPFVVPSYPVLESAVRILRPLGVTVGAQDVSDRDGAATGEVSARILSELGVRLVEVGHAERREHFGDTEEVVATKVRAALDAGLTPLLCVGEAEGADAGEAAEHVLAQLRTAVEARRLRDVVVAYEPLWAIGKAEPAPGSHIDGVASAVRSELGRHAPPIVYGGSAGPGVLSALREVDGVFLGRFAHDPANFGAVLDEALAAAA